MLPGKREVARSRQALPVRGTRSARRPPGLPDDRTEASEFEPTKRQAQIIALVAAGKANKTIARELDVTESDVEKILGLLYRRMNLSGRAALTAWWVTRQIRRSDSRAG